LLEVYHGCIQGEIANLILERLPADDQSFPTSYVAAYDRFAAIWQNSEDEPFSVIETTQYAEKSSNSAIELAPIVALRSSLF